MVRLGDESQSAIHRAHRHIEQSTCIRFVPKRRENRDYISYINQPGCWSYVGKIGGEQVVSLGYGCETVGTAVHETSHALGLWHEQSRADRNSYVKIQKKNVSPSGREQFGKRPLSESFSKGYAYDYNSIMHYGEKYFSSNGKPTIEIKGIGKKLGLKIGQRKKLSDIDVAQLNDVYYCNAKEQVERVCGKDWEPFDGSCYKFVADDTKIYPEARDACSKLGGRLAQLTGSSKDIFIKKELKEKHEDIPTWRVGGRKIGGRFKWEDPQTKRHRNMKYTAWAPGQPDKYTTLVLDRISRSNDSRVWKGTWAGTPSKPNQFAFPYICEKKDYKCDNGWINWREKCYQFQTDKQQFDRAHRKCVSHSGHLLQINDEHEDAFIKDHLITKFPNTEKWRTGGKAKSRKFYWYDDKNRHKKMSYRNWAPNQPGQAESLVITRYDGTPKRFVWKGAPAGHSSKPETYKYSYVCEKPAKLNCLNSTTKDGRDYRGNLSYTESGVSCQAWTSQYPHRHDYMSGNVHRDKRDGLGEHNYCRNPGGRRARPWCFVPLKKTVWQYCDMSICK